MKLSLIIPANWWQPAKFITEENQVIQFVSIPAGFVTDGASVPRSLTLLGLLFLIAGHWFMPLFIPGVLLVLSLALFPRFGKSFRAALLHDYLLQQNPDKWISANIFFLAQLFNDGIHWSRAYTMFAAVTIYQAFMAVIRFLKCNLTGGRRNA